MTRVTFGRQIDSARSEVYSYSRNLVHAGRVELRKWNPMEILLQINAGIRLRFFFMLGITLPCLLLSACDIGSPALPTLTPESAVTPSVTFMRNDATQTPSQPQSTPDTTSQVASPTTDTAADSRIVYLAPDGFTVMSVRQDGLIPRSAALIQKMPDRQVINLSADPTGKFIVYNLASTGPDKFLLETHCCRASKT